MEAAVTQEAARCGCLIVVLALLRWCLCCRQHYRMVSLFGALTGLLRRSIVFQRFGRTRRQAHKPLLAQGIDDHGQPVVEVPSIPI